MAVVKQLNEKDLSTFLPTIGDRISVKLFAEEELKKTVKGSQKKESLVKTLCS